MTVKKTAKREKAAKRDLNLFPANDLLTLSLVAIMGLMVALVFLR